MTLSICKVEIICLLYYSKSNKSALFNSGAIGNVLEGCKIIIDMHFYFIEQSLYFS